MNNNKDSKIENSLPVNIDQIRCDAFEAGFLAVYSGDYPQQALRNAQLREAQLVVESILTYSR
jgi:hypothetical protein